MRISDNPKLKKLHGWTVVAVVLIAVVCTCPFPVRVNTTMAGYYVDAQQQSAEQVEVDVTGWYLRYLFFTDDLRVEFDLPDSEKNYVKIEDTQIMPGFEGLWKSFMYYNSDLNRMDVATLFADKAFEKCMIIFAENDYYVLSSEPNADLNEFRQEVQTHWHDDLFAYDLQK